MRVAVIGSGISGCAATWSLSEWADVTVFESDNRLGGHTHTQTLTIDEKTFAVDTGFIVFNHRTYPGLKAWFEELGVDCAPSDMSFSASLNDGALEWCGTNLNSVFAQRKNLVAPKFWVMLADILRFNREAPIDAARFRQSSAPSPTLGAYLEQGRYRGLFLEAYLLPMAGAIWSCPPRQMREFPMTTFTRFCENHGLLSLTNRPQWFTVRNGAINYLHKLKSTLDRQQRQVQWRTSCPIKHITPEISPQGQMRVGLQGTDKGCEFNEVFDAVILACHSDQAAELLPKTMTLQSIANQVRYQDNLAVLHTDLALMPKRKSAWASWNYLHNTREDHDSNPVSVTYWMNQLQPIPVERPILVTLNPNRSPDPSQVLNQMHYAHPVFDGPAIEAQRLLPKAQGEGSIWLAGAWTRYGFHEDGFQSGQHAAQLVRQALHASGHVDTLSKAA